MTVQLLSKSAYARHRGCDEKAVRKAITEGRISTIEGKIDPVVADIQWAQNTRVRAGSGQAATHAMPAATVPVDAAAEPPVSAADDEGEGSESVAGTSATRPVGGSEYSASRARREKADAEMAEIALAERRGEVIPVKAVEIVWSQAMSSLREHLLQLRARLAPILAAETDAFRVGELLDAEHRAALELMAKASYTAPGGEG